MARVSFSTKFGDAILAASYILNLVSSNFVPNIPYELLTYIISKFATLGGLGYICNHFHENEKMDCGANKCVFIRYFKRSKDLCDER